MKLSSTLCKAVYLLLRRRLKQLANARRSVKTAWRENCYLRANMPGRRCLRPADCLLSNESPRRCAWFALIFTPRLKRYEGRGLRWHRACFDETPVQSHFLLSRQFLNLFPHSSSSVLPISAFTSLTPSLLPNSFMTSKWLP